MGTEIEPTLFTGAAWTMHRGARSWCAPVLQPQKQIVLQVSLQAVRLSGSGCEQVQKHAEKLQRAKEEAALGKLRAQWPELSEAVLVLALEEVSSEARRDSAAAQVSERARSQAGRACTGAPVVAQWPCAASFASTLVYAQGPCVQDDPQRARPHVMPSNVAAV